MSLFGCNFKCSCTAAAALAGLLIGIIGAFLQITGVITVTIAFLWVVFGIAVVYLGLLVLTSAFVQRTNSCTCRCRTLSTVLAGILGTIALAVILLAVGIVATSVVSAVLVGLLLFFFTLTLAGTACYVRCISDCSTQE